MMVTKFQTGNTKRVLDYILLKLSLTHYFYYYYYKRLKLTIHSQELPRNE